MRRTGFAVAVMAGLSLLLAGCAAAPSTSSTCPLQVAADFPVTLLHGHNAIVTIHIGGQAFRMLVDSGSSNTYFTSAAFERLSVVPNQVRISGYSTGLGGTVQNNFAFIDDITFGSTRVKNEVFLVNDYILPAKNGVEPVDGILGDDVLQQFNVAYDFPDRHIKLFYLQHCAIGKTPWRGDYDLETITENPETLALTIPISIDDQQLAMILDTGAEVGLISQSALDAHHITPEVAPRAAHFDVVGAGRHRVTVQQEQFATIDIGAETFSNAWLPVSNGAALSIADGLIGDDFLLHHRVFIETDSGTAYIGLTVPGG